MTDDKVGAVSSHPAGRDSPVVLVGGGNRVHIEGPHDVSKPGRTVDLWLILGGPQQRSADSCDRQLRSPLLRAGQKPRWVRRSAWVQNSSGQQERGCSEFRGTSVAGPR